MSISAIGNDNQYSQFNQINGTDYGTDVQNAGPAGGRGFIQNGSIQNIDDAVSKFSNKLSSQLNLTDSQKASLVDLLKKDFADFNSANKSSGQTGDDKSNIKALFDKIDNDVKGILNPDQLTKFNSIVSSRQNHHHHKKVDNNSTNSSDNNNAQQTINGIQPDGSVNALV